MTQPLFAEAAGPADWMAAKHSSADVEHYTPPDVIERARRLMGAIDLDPASCAKANTIVKAARYFTREDDGLLQSWSGRVWLNPPGGITDDQQRRVLPKCRETGACGLPKGHTHETAESSTRKFWRKLVTDWQSGAVEQAVFLAFNIEFLQTSQVDSPLAAATLPFCIPSRRIQFLYDDGEPSLFDHLKVGGGPTHANAIIYLPPRDEMRGQAQSFLVAFDSLGTVVLP